MSDSVRSHRRQPTRLPRPWDSPGKNTGVGCHFLLQCMKVTSENEVAQSCLTPSHPMDCSLAGSSVHGSFSVQFEMLSSKHSSTVYGLVCRHCSHTSDPIILRATKDAENTLRHQSWKRLGNWNSSEIKDLSMWKDP